jgi:hypothetical protein
MQELKEEFRKIYETSKNPTEGLLSISEWLAKSSSVFTKSCQTTAILILMLEADFSTPTKNVITLIMTE